jgi:endonuclease YncB( thermonuclease family)
MSITVVTAKARQTHAGTVLRVVDGDTIDVSVPLASTRRADGDLGFHLYAQHGQVVLHLSVRLLGCNAIEHDQPGGMEAKQHLQQLLPVGTVVTLATVKNDKYSRFDAAVTLPDGSDLVTGLIRDGWAAPYTGEGVKNTPAWPRQGGST